MEGYLFHILKLNAVVSAVILFTVFLGKRLKNKYTAGWKYVIWLLLSLVLLFPVNLFPRGVVTVKIAEEATGDFVESQDGTSGGENESRETAGPLAYVRENVSSREIRLSAERISWRGLLQIFFPLWIAGIVLTGLFRILQYQYSLGRIKRWSVPETDRGIKRMYRTECINKHIRRPPVLLRVENLESPLLAGLFRTALYIPEKGYSAEELRLIFSHELFHYQKKDLWYKLLLMTVSVLYWFNPFLILMRIEAEKDIENLRDRQVICGCQVQERKLYQQQLLKTAALDRNLTPHLAASLNDSFLVFKERIFYMKRAAKLKRGMLPAVLAGFLVFFLNGLVGTSVEAPSAHRPEGIRRALLEEASRDAERAMMEAETPIQAASPDRSGIVPGSGSSAAAAWQAEGSGLEPGGQPQDMASGKNAYVEDTPSGFPGQSEGMAGMAEPSQEMAFLTEAPPKTEQFEPGAQPESQPAAETLEPGQAGDPGGTQTPQEGEDAFSSAENFQRLKEAGGTVEGTVLSRDISSITLQLDDGAAYTFPFCEWTTVVAGEPGDHIAMEYLGELQGSPMAQYAYPSAAEEDLTEGIKIMNGTLIFEGNDSIGIRTPEGQEYNFMLHGVPRPEFLTPGEAVQVQYYGSPGSGEVVSFTRQ